MATIFHVLPQAFIDPNSLSAELNQSHQANGPYHLRRFSLPISLALILMYSKQKIQQLVADKPPLFFYSGCTEEQQKNFIHWVKMCGPEVNKISQEQLSSDQFK